LEPYRDQLGVASHGTLCFGLVSTTLAALRLALGDPAGAAEHLREAVRRADEMGAAFEQVRSRRLMAEARTAGDGFDADAVRLGLEAMELAKRHGFSAERRQLERLLTTRSVLG
jgi:hypothetical protein